MYLNADGVNLLYANANVTLRANSIGTNKDWNFGNTGVLTLPNSGVINASGNSVDIGSDDAISLEANAAVSIYTDTNGNAYQWTFGTDGNLTLPAGGIVYETSIPGGVLAGNTIALNPQGGTSTDQQLLIYPTVIPGTDDNHLHLTTGNLYNTELFLGNDNLYVKLANTGNVVVNSNDDTGNTAQWTFGTNGNLTLPGNIIAINYANGNRVTGGVTFDGEAVIGTGTSNTQSGLYLAPDPVSLTNDLYLRVRGNIIDEPTHIHFDTGNNQYYSQFIGDDNKYIQLANTGNIVINTNNYAGNSAQWTFDTTGNITPPSNVLHVLGNIISSKGAYFVGNTDSGDSALYAGIPGREALGPGTVAQFAGDTHPFDPPYSQINFINVRGNASADWVATANNGTDSTFYIDMGMAGNAHADPVFFTGTSTANDGYLYVVGANIAGPGDVGPGNLILGSTNGQIKMFVGNPAQANVVQTITTQGVSITGNVSAVGNIVSGNLTVGSGTITGGNVNGANFNGNVAFGTGTVGGSGNISGGNILTGGVISATGNVSGGNIITAGNVTGNTAGFAIGYRDIPQVSFTANATIATTDAGKHYYSTLSTGNVLTIANNASQGFQVGAAITVINQGTGNITVAQGSGVTLYLAGNATAGNRTVATFGMATIIKVATDTWFINGTGVS